MLCDHTFETQAGGVGEKVFSIPGNVFGKLDGAIGTIEEVAQQVPAHGEFGPRQVMPVEIDQVKGVKDRFARGLLATTTA